MTQILPTSILPSAGTRLSVKDRTSSVQFGNGYQQDAPQGINYQYEVWDVSFELLTLDQRNAIRTPVLAASTWDIILWTAPGGVQKKYKRPKDSDYTENRVGHLYNISFQLKQVF